MSEEASNFTNSRVNKISCSLSRYFSNLVHKCDTMGTETYVYMPISIGEHSGEAFVDSGCTFSAISMEFAERCGLDIMVHPKPLRCAVGGDQTITLKRQTATVTFNMYKVGTWSTTVFVMDKLPAGKAAIFGTDFLDIVDPVISWRTRTVEPSRSAPYPAKSVDPTQDPMDTNTEADTNTDSTREEEVHFIEQQLYHFDHQLSTSSGDTQVIGWEEYGREVEAADPDSFCFVLNPQTQKVTRYENQDWENLEKNPAYHILRKYKDTVFKESLGQDDKKITSSIEHEIDLADDTPFAVKQFRLSPEQKLAVDKWVEEMETAGLIRKSTSPFNSPIFCVKKPVGWRIVMDYRILNSKTKMPQGPIPRKEDILNAMTNSKYFSCMDLLSGYYQQRLRESDAKYTAFSTPSGHYEYVVTAQGLCGAPSSFNRWVQSIFEEIRDISRAYFDDIYVFTKEGGIQAHCQALDRVLKKCEDNGLAIKLAKCVFAAPEIPVLGDFVGRQGVRMDPDKVDIIKSWPVPKTRHQLRSFLGTVSYCSRFCKEYGSLVVKLQPLVVGKRKHEKIQLGRDQLAAFEALKVAMCNTPVLALPDFSRPFGIRMDASDYGIGGVLFQCDDSGTEHPVAYTGRSMNKNEINYPVREKELLAIIHALRTWRHYLLDQPFSVETDHQSLEALLTQRTCTQRLARWLNFLSEYRPEFKWIPGASNDTADGLSRRVDFQPDGAPASAVSLQDLLQSIVDEMKTTQESEETSTQASIHFQNLDHAMMTYNIMRINTNSAIPTACKSHYASDPTFAEPWKYFLQGGKNCDAAEAGFKHFQCDDGLLWYEKPEGSDRRLCIPNDVDLRRQVIFSEHDSMVRGHPGIYKTSKFVENKYYWPNMNKTIKNYIQSCEKCQRNKHRQSKRPGRLNPLPIPETRWQHITMDFILDLPVSNGSNAIWVIVDRLTKRAHFIPIHMGNRESSARVCAETFMREYQRLHGIPESIVSDRDTRFTSTFWKEFMKLQGTTQILSSAFKPSTDGQTERTNRFIEDYLRNYVHVGQRNWSELLSCAEIAYNSRVHVSIGMSPFEADLGYIPRSIPDIQFDKMVGSKSAREAFELGKRQVQTLKLLKENLTAAQARMKKYYDANRPVQDFEKGQKVLLSVANLNIEHLGITIDSSRKFGPLWIGPYHILEKTSLDTYRLKLPIGLRIHPEFHTSLLKPYNQDPDPNRWNLPNEGMVVAGSQEEGQLIDKIISHKKRRGKIYYYVKWLGQPDNQNSWEPLDSLRKPATVLIKEYLKSKGLDEDLWLP